MLCPDQQPVADDGGRRHGEVVQGVDASEAVLVAGLDDEGVALFAQSRATGAWMHDVAGWPDLPGRVRLTLKDFRTSYVLRYRPVGVKPEGWNQIDVRVKGGHTVDPRTGHCWGALNPKG